MTEQLGFMYFMPLSELCDPCSAMVKAEDGFCRLVDHWKYNSLWEMDHVCISNGLDSSYMDSLKLTSYFREFFLGGKYNSLWEMDHVCIRNGLDSSYMDSLKLTSYFREFFLGLQRHVNKFEYNDSLVRNDFTEPFGWGACHSFLQHDVQGFIGANKFEDKAKVGQWEISNKSHNAPKLFMDAKHGLDLRHLPPKKSRGDIVLFVKLYDRQREELGFAGRLFIKASEKPLEVLRKLNKMAGFMPYEKVAEFTYGVFRHEPTRGVFHSNLQRCKYSCRSNSCFKNPGFAPIDASRISWIMILWNLRQRNVCCFHQPPLLEVVACKFSELPQEILMDIFALLETPDLVRAGSVCCSWNSAYTSLCSFGRYKWPQTPCLIYTAESAGDNVAFIHSLGEKRTYKLTLPAPPIHRRYLIGSSDGWLVTADERSEMHLVNPITSEQIPLPSVTTIEHVTPIFDENGAICKYGYSQHTATSVTGPPSTFSLSTLRDHLFQKALLFFTASGSYIVVLIHDPFGQISFARLGDEKWTWLPPHSNFEDCIYKDGLLYAVTLRGQIITFDISGTVVTTNIIMDRKDKYGAERVYLVQDPLGDLMLVRRPEVWIKEAPAGHGHNVCANQSTFGNRSWKIAIYKVCIASRKLVQINSLDDHALFLGHSQSLCLSAEEYPQVKPNHVYLTDDSRSVSWKCKLRRRLVIGMLNLETKIMDEIVSPPPWSNCMAPLLMIPNPRKLDSAFQS